MKMRCGGVAVIVILMCSCANQEKGNGARVQDENAVLGGEIAARVGSEKIPLSIVQSVARRQQIGPREALRQ